MTTTGPPHPVPTFPSLYNPTLEVIDFEHRPPIRRGGHYLSNANDVFRFTFYWTLIFHSPLFLFAGIYAFFNLAFPPYRLRHPPRPPKSVTKHRAKEPSLPIPLTPISSRRAPSPQPPLPHTVFLAPHSPTSPHVPTPPASSSDSYRPPAPLIPFVARPHQPNERRTRYTYALLVLFVFFAADVASALLGSVVVGYLLAALYAAGKFNVSTWVPFVWALIITCTGVLGIFPSVINRI